jgi:hypothetical protein
MFSRMFHSIESRVVFTGFFYAGIAIALLHGVKWNPGTPNLLVCLLCGIALPVTLQVPGILMRSLDKKRLQQDHEAYRKGNLIVALMIGLITGLYLYAAYPRFAAAPVKKTADAGQVR